MTWRAILTLPPTRHAANIVTASPYLADRGVGSILNALSDVLRTMLRFALRVTQSIYSFEVQGFQAYERRLVIVLVSVTVIVPMTGVLRDVRGTFSATISRKTV